MAGFVEAPGGDGDFEAVGQRGAPTGGEPAVVAGGRHIDRTTPFRGDEGKPSGGERAAEKLHGAFAGGLGGAELEAAGLVGAGAGAGPRASAAHGNGDQLHDPAERGVAPGGRAAAADYFDAGERFPRELAPEHPAAERVVERNTVEEDERAAGSARTEPAKGNALRGGIGGKAVAAAEETETRDRAEGAVEGDRGGRAKVSAVNQPGGKCHAVEGLSGPGGGHDEAIEALWIGRDTGAITRDGLRQAYGRSRNGA